MIDVTLPMALAIWDELRDAEAGINRYGGHVAEIYAFRLSSSHPRLDTEAWDPHRIGFMDAALSRSRSLYEILDHYANTRSVEIQVDDRDLGPWILKDPFVHRCYVRVLRKRST